MKLSRTTRCCTLLPTSFLAGLLAVTGAQGATPVEEMSRTVESLCPALKAAFTRDPQSLTPAERDVYFRCAELKLAAGQNFSNLSGAQVQGLSNMTSDETSVMGTSTVALSGTQNVAVLGRLAIVRGKSAGSVAKAPSDPAGTTTLSEETAAAGLGTRPLQATGELPGNATFDFLSGYEGRFSQMSEYGKWGVFVNGSYGTGDMDGTSREPGFDFDAWSLVSGVDYRLTDQLILGFAASYAVTDSSLDNSGGDVDLDGFGGTLYGTYYVGEFYVDFLAGLATKDYDTERNLRYSVPSQTGGTTTVDQTFTGSTDASDVTFGVGAGYNLLFGGLTLTPFAQLTYLQSDIDGYTERLQGSNTNAGFGLNLTVDDQEIESLASTLGVQFARAINTPRGVLTPYLRMDWEHEYEDDSNITAHFAEVSGNFAALNTIVIPTDDPDSDFFNLGAGLSAVLPGGFQCFLDYATILGYEDLTLHRVVAGLRWEF